MWPYQNWKRINKIYFFNYQSVSYYQFQYPDRILAVVTLRCYSVEFLTSGKWVILPGDTGSDSRLSACSQLQWLRPDRSPLQAHWPLTERRQERRRPSSPTALHPLTSSPTQRVCGAYTDTTAKVCSYHQRLCSKHILAYYCYGSMQYGIFWKKKILWDFLSMHITTFAKMCTIRTEHTVRIIVYPTMQCTWFDLPFPVWHYLFRLASICIRGSLTGPVGSLWSWHPRLRLCPPLKPRIGLFLILF